jgi:hypothetical protein
VVRVDSGAGFDWGELQNLGEVERLVGPREGKVELGVFVREEGPEFTEALRRIREVAGGL